MPLLRVPRSTTPERLAAVVGALIIAVMLAAVLTDSRPRLAATNTRVLISAVALTVGPGQEHCQGGEFVPRQVSHLRMYVSTFDRPTGVPLDISIRDAQGDLMTSAHVPGGYPTGVLMAQIRQPTRNVESGSFCLRNSGEAAVALAGNETPLNLEALPAGVNPTRTAAANEGIRVDYLRPGRESWLQLAPEVARRFQLFKPSFFGLWTLWAVMALALLSAAGSVGLQCRSSRFNATPSSHGPNPGSSRPRLKILGRAGGPLRWLPAAGWACAGIATMNAGLWASITPPFQVPDEPSHVGYAQWLAESGRLPDLSVTSKPLDLFRVGEDYLAVLKSMPFSVEGKPSWSSGRDKELRVRLGEHLSRREEAAAGGAARYSPLYYALEAVPARVGVGLNALDRLYAMRLFSAPLAGLTVAFVFLFLRELLPGTPWAWTLGALAVALQPVFGFISGGVNNDAMLFAAGALVLYLFARAFRRGLNTGLGLAMGVASAIGFLAKPTLLAVLPGAALGLLVMVRQTRPGRRGDAARGAAAAVAGFAVPILIWLGLEITVLHRPISATTGALSSDSLNIQLSLRGQLSYLWQYFLPRLPFMEDVFRGYPAYPVWDVYIQGFIGRFGWFQYGFPLWANRLGLGVLLGVAAAAATALVRARSGVRSRLGELACYSAMILGLVALNAIAGYRFNIFVGVDFEQPRYLFAALALYGALVALAARGAGRRWGPSVAAFLVVVGAGHSLFAMLLTVSRYYA